MKTKSILLIFLLCCILSVASYLAYQWNEAAILCEKSASEKLRECQSLQEKTDTTLKKLATKNPKQLLTTLQRVKPTLGIIMPNGNWLDIAKPLPVFAGLRLKAIPDSILLARFPDEFGYEVRDAYIVGMRAPYGFGHHLPNDSLNTQKMHLRSGDGLSISADEILYVNSKGKKTNIRQANALCFSIK